MIDAGLIGPRGTLPCPPSYQVGGNVYHNWNRVNEGMMDFSDALMRSCDTYFYDLAIRQWDRERQQGDDVVEALPTVSERFGFGRRLGIDLPGEGAGRVPGRQWRQAYHLATRDRPCAAADAAAPGRFARELLSDLCQFGGIWRGGDAINSSIGQGDVLATPLQVAASYQAIANDGVLMDPYLVNTVRGPDLQPISTHKPTETGAAMSPENARLLKQMMVGVVTDGTGGRAAIDGFTVGGKTGTAQSDPKRKPFAWFTSFAEVDGKQVAVAVMIEDADIERNDISGGRLAAPIARDVMKAALE
jgi:cell division protein FtsI/penicillin-binding protein 2